MKTMKTDFRIASILQGLSAAAVALALTWTLSWNFVDSTRLARWVRGAEAAVAAMPAAGDASALAGSFRTGLIK